MPRDLVKRFHEARRQDDAQLVVAASADRSHPVIGLRSVALRDDLRRVLVEEGIRKIDRWTDRYRPATVAWPAEPVAPFFNANTVKDLSEAERMEKLAIDDQAGRKPASSKAARLEGDRNAARNASTGARALRFVLSAKS